MVAAATRGDPTHVYVDYNKAVVLGSGTYGFSALVAEQSRAFGGTSSEVVITLSTAIPDNTALNLIIQGVTDQETPANILLGAQAQQMINQSAIPILSIHPQEHFCLK